MTHDNPRMGDLNELVERLNEDDEMLRDGLQFPGLNEAWHNVVMKQAAKDCAQAAAALTSLIAERDGLREALEFYAEPTNYKGEFVPGGTTDHGTFTMSHHVNLVRRDAGTRARTALSLDTKEGG